MCIQLLSLLAITAVVGAPHDCAQYCRNPSSVDSWLPWCMCSSAISSPILKIKTDGTLNSDETAIYYEPAEIIAGQPEIYFQQPFYILNPTKVFKVEAHEEVRQFKKKDVTQPSIKEQLYQLDENYREDVITTETKNIDIPAHALYIDIGVKNKSASNDIDENNIKAIEENISECLDLHALTHAYDNTNKEKPKLEKTNTEKYAWLSDKELSIVIANKCNKTSDLVHNSFRDMQKALPTRRNRSEKYKRLNNLVEEASRDLERKPSRESKSSISSIDPNFVSSVIESSNELNISELNNYDLEKKAFSNQSLFEEPYTYNTSNFVNGSEDFNADNHDGKLKLVPAEITSPVDAISGTTVIPGLLSNHSKVSHANISLRSLNNATEFVSEQSELSNIENGTSNNMFIETTSKVHINYDIKNKQKHELGDKNNFTLNGIKDSTSLNVENKNDIGAKIPNSFKNQENKIENIMSPLDNITQLSYNNMTPQQNINIKNNNTLNEYQNSSEIKVRPYYLEKDLKIPAFMIKEMFNGSILSNNSYEMIPNNDFEVNDPTKKPQCVSGSSDYKENLVIATALNDTGIQNKDTEITGKLYFMFNEQQIPVRFLQKQNGQLNIGIDGPSLCEKIFNNSETNSIFLRKLCAVNESNNAK